MSFSQSDLEAIAAAYDPRTHEAPIVVGHPKTDAPAYGWIEKVIAKADGLYAVPRQLNAEFSELVKGGAYKKISAAFYPRNASTNPKPGISYLRHIGFLGAEPPSIKGLQAIQFSEGDAMCFAEEDMSTLREYSLSVRENAVMRRELEDTIRKAGKEGRIPIGLMQGVMAFSDSLADGGSFEFSEGEDAVSVNQQKWFIDFVTKLPVPVVTREIATGEFSEGDTAFETPPGYSVSQQSAQLHSDAQTLMRQNGVSFIDAVRMAEKRLNGY